MEEGLRNVLLIYSIAPLVAGVLIWIVIPDRQYVGNRTGKQPGNGAERGDVRAALRMPQVWLIALIVFCSYVLYVGAFDFPAFAERAYGRSRTFGALLGTIRDWMRPVAAISAGFLADRFTTNRTLRASFLLLILGFLSMSILRPASGQIWILWVQIIVCALAGFSLRGIYFALLEETHIPVYLTGITVGLVSFLGFTPDIFLHAMSGWFVHHFPDTLGYRYYFGVMAAVALVGWLAAHLIRRYSRRNLADSFQKEEAASTDTASSGTHDN